jgi:poly(A) polymerase
VRYSQRYSIYTSNYDGRVQERQGSLCLHRNATNHSPGAAIVDKIIVGSASWSELFAKHDFFHKYRYYLQVIASTGDADLQLKWYDLAFPFWKYCITHSYRSGTVESRLRQLVMKLEFVETLTLAHPFIKGFEDTAYCLTDEEVRAVAQGDISEAVRKRKKEDIEGKEGSSTVYTSTFYIGLAIEPKPGKWCILQVLRGVTRHL